jgi:hypothetical protein
MYLLHHHGLLRVAWRLFWIANTTMHVGQSVPGVTENETASRRVFHPVLALLEIIPQDQICPTL